MEHIMPLPSSVAWKRHKHTLTAKLKHVLLRLHSYAFFLMLMYTKNFINWNVNNVINNRREGTYQIDNCMKISSIMTQHYITAYNTLAEMRNKLQLCTDSYAFAIHTSGSFFSIWDSECIKTTIMNKILNPVYCRFIVSDRFVISHTSARAIFVTKTKTKTKTKINTIREWEPEFLSCRKTKTKRNKKFKQAERTKIFKTVRTKMGLNKQ